MIPCCRRPNQRPTAWSWLTPAQAAAGQGTAANFVVRVVNTGSVTETFTLSAVLPAGVTAQFGQLTIEVPPGASNYLDVSLRLIPQPGTTPGSSPFQVSAVAANRAEVSDTASGILNVLASGVHVTLNPPSAHPAPASR